MLVWKRTSGRPFFFFFFNDTATTEIYTLSLHDALPICHRQARASTLLSSAPQKLRVHVLAHADVVHQIPARVIRIQVDDELVARPAPGRGDRPIPVRNLEHTAWQPNVAGCKVKATDRVEVRRADEPEVPRLEWVVEVEARIVGRGVPIPAGIPHVWRPGGRSAGLGEWCRVAGPASHRLVRDDRRGS